MYKLSLDPLAADKHLSCYYQAIYDILDCLISGGVVKYPVKIGKQRSHSIDFLLAQNNSCVRQLFALIQSYNQSRETSLLVASPGRLASLVSDVNRYVAAHKWMPNKTPLKECLALLAHIFSYDRFADNKGLRFIKKTGRLMGYSQTEWSPLEYISSLDVTCCPYCNAESVYAIDFEKDANKIPVGLKRSARSALDHYFPKCEYPYLAISLCNLIPSCTRCNTDIKGERGLQYGKNIHPFEESFHDGARFVCIPRVSSSGLRPDSITTVNDFDLDVEDGGSATGAIKARAVNSSVFFMLPRVYNELFKYDALSAIYRSRVAGSEYYEWVRSKLGGNLSDNQIRGLFCGIMEDEKKINKIRLAKLAIDMYKMVYEATRQHSFIRP